MSGNGHNPPPSTEQMLEQAAAQGLFMALQQLYPLEDPKKLGQIAMQVAKEQQRLRPVIEAYHENKQTHVAFDLVAPAAIYMPGAPRNALQIVAPMRLEKCKDMEQVMKSITAFSIIASPISQAILALHGYKLRVNLGSMPEKAQAVDKD